MVATALALPADDPAGAAARWRQLVDIVVQAGGSLSESARAAALSEIAAVRALVPRDERLSTARQLANRAAGRDSIIIFGTDEPGIAAPVLMTARVEIAEWQAAIPRILSSSRALLRNRRDLPPPVIAALAAYGSSDFALPAADAAAAPDAGTQIRELVARIEAFRQNSRPAAAPIIDVPAESFDFETAADGTIDWVANVPREALIGLAIGDTGEAGQSGVDGQAAGAFRRRAPFRDARLSVAGRGSTAGIWLISASPIFNPRDGRFAGYHGAARRPRPEEVLGPVTRFAGTSLPVDSVRQLIHELRTPLNAILGFAEMIDQQLLGPAATSYRSRAKKIMLDGNRLLELVDDLDQAARMRVDAGVPGSSDARVILHDVIGNLRAAMDVRGVLLVIDAPQPVVITGPGRQAVERLMTRLIGATVGLAAAGETMSVELSCDADQLLLVVGRPRALAGVAQDALRDPGFDPEAPFPDAPLLGLGFTLRLVDSLARAAGGQLAIDDASFTLALPRAEPSDLPVGIPSE